ncbi:hypothetical protein COB72_01680 [bacterium]|nr:MAG: hypothetical protein COB72_01680 [bacterium]
MFRDGVERLEHCDAVDAQPMVFDGVDDPHRCNRQRLDDALDLDAQRRRRCLQARHGQCADFDLERAGPVGECA